MMFRIGAGRDRAIPAVFVSWVRWIPGKKLMWRIVEVCEKSGSAETMKMQTRVSLKMVQFLGSNWNFQGSLGGCLACSRNSVPKRYLELPYVQLHCAMCTSKVTLAYPTYMHLCTILLFNDQLHGHCGEGTTTSR
jgi:hypothetical protein